MSLVPQVTALPGPVVAFSREARDIRMLGDLPGWEGLTGNDERDHFDNAIKAFNRGELEGIAFTYAAGSMGFRLSGARTLALIGSAPINSVAQATARAPGARTVTL